MGSRVLGGMSAFCLNPVGLLDQRRCAMGAALELPMCAFCLSATVRASPMTHNPLRMDPPGGEPGGPALCEGPC
eukprot:649644-Pyramimonas_sp.AAC.1